VARISQLALIDTTPLALGGCRVLVGVDDQDREPEPAPEPMPDKAWYIEDRDGSPGTWSERTRRAIEYGTKAEAEAAVDAAGLDRKVYRVTDIEPARVTVLWPGKCLTCGKTVGARSYCSAKCASKGRAKIEAWRRSLPQDDIEGQGSLLEGCD